MFPALAGGLFNPLSHLESPGVLLFKVYFNNCWWTKRGWKRGRSQGFWSESPRRDKAVIHWEWTGLWGRFRAQLHIDWFCVLNYLLLKIFHCIHSFILLHWWIHSFIYSSVCSFIHPFAHSWVCVSHIHSFILLSFIHSLVHSFISVCFFLIYLSIFKICHTMPHVES